jgi:3'-phosphoadenosine 5'-phosphosulfate sulfotransferase (PAPS reductase)/FAD synthetase
MSSQQSHQKPSHSSESFEAHSPTERGNRVLRDLRENHDPDHVVVALSGGHDSSTALRFALESPEITVDEAVHMDTGIGLSMTKEYVKDVCDQWDVDLTILGDHNARYPHESYRFLVRTFGFPGSHPDAHSGMWKNLKNKLRTRYESTLGGDVAFISGVRKHESTVRYEEIPDSGIGEVGGTIWASPLIDFTDADLQDYREEHSIPRNEAYSILHASGECLCGSFEDRHNLPFIRTVEPETAQQIDRLEFEAVELAARGEIDVKYALWANGSLSAGEYEARTEEKQVGLTCGNCEQKCPSEPYDRTGEALSPAEKFLNENSLHDYWNRKFYCAPCDEVVDDPFGHRKEVHPFDEDEGLAGEWDMRMIDYGASADVGYPITEPNGWNLHINQLITDKGEAAIRKHRYYYDDYALKLCHRQQYTDNEHEWETYNGGPTLICQNCGAFNLRDFDIENPGPPVVESEPNIQPDFEEVASGQHALSDFKKTP